jgi:hypothetical protein
MIKVQFQNDKLLSKCHDIKYPSAIKAWTTHVQITYLPTVPNFSCIFSREKPRGRFSTRTVLF